MLFIIFWYFHFYYFYYQRYVTIFYIFLLIGILYLIYDLKDIKCQSIKNIKNSYITLIIKNGYCNIKKYADSAYDVYHDVSRAAKEVKHEIKIKKKVA